MTSASTSRRPASASPPQLNTMSRVLRFIVPSTSGSNLVPRPPAAGLVCYYPLRPLGSVGTRAPERTAMRPLAPSPPAPAGRVSPAGDVGSSESAVLDDERHAVPAPLHERQEVPA